MNFKGKRRMVFTTVDGKLADAGKVLHDRVHELRESDPKLSFQAAKRQAFKENPDLVRQYVLGDRPDEEIVTRAQQTMALHPHMNFTDATKYVLRADPNLARRYREM